MSLLDVFLQTVQAQFFSFSVLYSLMCSVYFSPASSVMCAYLGFSWPLPKSSSFVTWWGGSKVN